MTMSTSSAPSSTTSRTSATLSEIGAGRDGRDAAVARIGTDRLRAKGRHLAGRVGALERRQVHHPHGQLERLELRLLLDRALRERRRALLERDCVDGADPWESRLEGQLEAARECWRLRHALSVG